MHKKAHKYFQMLFWKRVRFFKNPREKNHSLIFMLSLNTKKKIILKDKMIIVDQLTHEQFLEIQYEKFSI